MVDTQVARRPPSAPPSRTISILPAAAVLGLAVLTLVVFGLMNMIGASSVATTTQPVIIGGLPVAATTSVFSHWVQTGEPPSDISTALLVPRGAVYAGRINTGGSSGDFDREVRVTVTAPRSHLLGFYRSHLEALGWRLYSTSSEAKSVELLFQKGGADGFYWEAGVNASATGPTTTYTFRLFQVNDFS